MFIKVISSGLALFFAVVLSVPGWGAYLAAGKPAPPFLVASGGDEKLTLDMVRGKIVVMFYEAREVIKKNLELKNELKKLYKSQPQDIRNRIFRLVVIDCADAYWLTLPFWKSKLVAHSKKEGLTIYGDWTRRMFLDYRMQGGESNFLIIDPEGIIRYSATGKISLSRFGEIKEVLAALIHQGRD